MELSPLYQLDGQSTSPSSGKVRYLLFPPVGAVEVQGSVLDDFSAALLVPGGILHESKALEIPLSPHYKRNPIHTYMYVLPLYVRGFGIHLREERLLRC